MIIENAEKRMAELVSKYIADGFVIDSESMFNLCFGGVNENIAERARIDLFRKRTFVRIRMECKDYPHVSIVVAKAHRPSYSHTIYNKALKEILREE